MKLPSRCPPRKGYHGRDMIKCCYCRTAKQKCSPAGRRWPTEKCSRCLMHDLPCSDGRLPQRQPRALTTKSSNSPTTSRSSPLIMPAGTNVISSSMLQAYDSQSELYHSVKLRGSLDSSTRGHPISTIAEPGSIKKSLILLSLHTVIMMALEELKSLSEQMVKPFKNDPNYTGHSSTLPGLEAIFDEYKLFALSLEAEKLRTGAGKILSHAKSTLKGHYYQRKTTLSEDKYSLQQMEEAILQYQDFGHFGLAHVLLMERLLERPDLADMEASRLIECRLHFLHEVQGLLQEGSFEPLVPKSFPFSQVFIPSKLLKIPIIAKHVAEVGLPDCLGRSVSHLMSDAGLSVDWSNQNINHYDILGRTGLYISCQNDNEYQVKKLLKSHADSRRAALNGLTPLHIAASMGHTSICRILWHRLNKKPKDGNAKPGDRIKKPEDQIFIEDRFGRTPFMWAAFCGHARTARYFHDFCLVKRTEKDFFGTNVIGLAACRGHLDVVEYCASQGFAIDEPDNRGRTPLWYAAHGSYWDILNFLRHRGAAIDCKDHDGLTPLSIAAQRGHTEVVSHLLQLSIYNPFAGEQPCFPVDINSMDKYGNCPIVLAAKAKERKCVKLFMDHARKGLKVESIIIAGQIATDYNDLEMVKILRPYWKLFAYPRTYLERSQQDHFEIGTTTTCLVPGLGDEIGFHS